MYAVNSLVTVSKLAVMNESDHRDKTSQHSAVNRINLSGVY